MIRLGLCCIFRNQPIRFRIATAKSLQSMDRKSRMRRLSSLCLHNAEALKEALSFCHENGIGCFRVNSRILPLKTHPKMGYTLEALPDFSKIKQTFLECGKYGSRKDIRITFHFDSKCISNGFCKIHGWHENISLSCQSTYTSVVMSLVSG